MRLAVLVLAATLLLCACSTPEQSARTRAVVDESARVFSAIAPLLVLIPGPAGPACVIAARAACAAVEAVADWPNGAGVASAAKP